MEDYGDDSDNAYGANEYYDDNMIEEEYADPEDFVEEENETGGAEDPETANIVLSGDPNNAAAKPSSTGVNGLEEKRIKNEDRTTPYMIKCERAPVLGTRVLQIRSI